MTRNPANLETRVKLLGDSLSGKKSLVNGLKTEKDEAKNFDKQNQVKHTFSINQHMVNLSIKRSLESQKQRPKDDFGYKAIVLLVDLSQQNGIDRARALLEDQKQYDNDRMHNSFRLLDKPVKPAPIILVATKSDLEPKISSDKLNQFAKEINAEHVFITNNRKEVKHIFELTAATTILNKEELAKFKKKNIPTEKIRLLIAEQKKELLTKIEDICRKMETSSSCFTIGKISKSNEIRIALQAFKDYEASNNQVFDADAILNYRNPHKKDAKSLREALNIARLPLNFHGGKANALIEVEKLIAEFTHNQAEKSNKEELPYFRI